MYLRAKGGTRLNKLGLRVCQALTLAGLFGRQGYLRIHLCNEIQGTDYYNITPESLWAHQRTNNTFVMTQGFSGTRRHTPNVFGPPYVLNSLLLPCFVQWYKAPNDYSCNVFVLPQRSNVTPVRVEGPPQLNITPVMYLTLQGAKRLLLYCLEKHAQLNQYSCIVLERHAQLNQYSCIVFEAPRGLGCYSCNV